MKPSSRIRFWPSCEALEDRTLLSTGNLDTAFGTDGTGKVITSLNDGTDRANDVAIDPQGRIVAIGSTTLNNGDQDFAIERYLADGRVDANFGTNHNGNSVFTFNLNGGQRDVAHAVGFQTINNQLKIVVAGEAEVGTAGDVDFAILRMNEDGTLDGTFGPRGGSTVVSFNLGGTNADHAYGMLIQPDGKIVVVGDAARGAGDTDFAIVRLTADGFVDPGNNFTDGVHGAGKVVVPIDFGPAGQQVDVARSAALQQGKIIVAGEAQLSSTDVDFAATRLNTNGSVDTTFGPNGNNGKVRATINAGIDRAYAVLVQPDDKFVLVGEAQVGANNIDFAVVRLSPNGEFYDNNNFAGGGKVTVDFHLGGNNTDRAYDVALQSDGMLVLVGEVETPGGSTDFGVVRLTAAGELDRAFDRDGLRNVAFDRGSDNADRAYAVAIQGNGQIVVAGEAAFVTQGINFAVCRFDLTPTGGGFDLSALFESTPALIIPVARDVTAMLSIARIKPKRKGGSRFVLILRNTSGQNITGDLFLVVGGLRTVWKVKLRGALGKTIQVFPNNSPFLAVSLKGGTLRPDEEVQIPLSFANPLGIAVRFQAFVYGGTPDLL